MPEVVAAINVEPMRFLDIKPVDAIEAAKVAQKASLPACRLLACMILFLGTTFSFGTYTRRASQRVVADVPPTLTGPSPFRLFRILSGRLTN